MLICTREQMIEMYRLTTDVVGITGLLLMEAAGRSAAEHLHRIVVGQHEGRLKTVGIFCGGGSKGGSGYVMARYLDSLGYDVDCLLMRHPEEIKGYAWTNLEILRRLRPGLLALSVYAPSMTVEELNQRLPSYDIYVDAMLGLGLEGKVPNDYRSVVQFLNEVRGLKIALEIPSGLDANTGRPRPIAFEADYTCSFGMGKNGLYLDPGRNYAGEVLVTDIGMLPETADEVGIQGELLTEDSLRYLAVPRPSYTPSGTFGHLGLIAGSCATAGAAALAAGAALTSGVETASVITRESVRNTILQHHPEAIVHPLLPESGGIDGPTEAILTRLIEEKSALAIGCGLGTEPAVDQLLQLILTQARVPVVIDADALPFLANDLDILGDTLCPVVLTPSPSQMARLTGKSVDAGMADPIEWAFELAQQTGSYLILRFSTVVICAPDGRYAINTTGNPGMASAGMSDVLTGLLAGLLSTGMTPWDACQLAVFAHGRAGDLAQKQVGKRALRAGQVVENIPNALSFLE
ncbi:MAG: NAD(P)H-hydrate dehydratase [Bradymonadales bacterium]|nr:NAD(P)H-hydrate dehydratase [Bradymonadales bacterium]